MAFLQFREEQGQDNFTWRQWEVITITRRRSSGVFFFLNPLVLLIQPRICTNTSHFFSSIFLVWTNLAPPHESLWNVRVGIFRVCPVRLWRHDNWSLIAGCFRPFICVKTLFPWFITFSCNSMEFLVICIMVLFDSMLKISETRMIQGNNIQHERTPCPPFYPVLLVCSSIKTDMHKDWTKRARTEKERKKKKTPPQYVRKNLLHRNDRCP